MESSATRRQTPTYFKPAPSEIQYGKMRFLITDRPSDLTINTYIEELGKHNARAVVRVCEPTYAKTPLISNGIDVLDWEFDDGSAPPPEDIKRAVSFMKNSALNTRRFQQAYKEWIPWARLYPSTQRPAKCVSAIAHSTGAGDYVCQML